MANEKEVLKRVINAMAQAGTIAPEYADMLKVELDAEPQEPVNIEQLTGEPPKETRHLSDLAPGTTFTAAGEKWVLLDKGTMREPGADPYEQGSTEIGFCIMKKAFLMNVEYNESETRKNYDESAIRKTIDEKVMPKLEAYYGDNLMTHTIGIMTVDGKAKNQSIECKVRPITFEEARSYNEYLKYNGPDFWTMTKWSTNNRKAMIVDADGKMSTETETLENAVRPVAIFRGTMEVEVDVEE